MRQISITSMHCIRTYRRARMHTAMQIRTGIHMDIHADIHTYIHTYIQTCLNTYLTCMHTYIHTYIHTYSTLHRYIHIYLHTHQQKQTMLDTLYCLPGNISRRLCFHAGMWHTMLSRLSRQHQPSKTWLEILQRRYTIRSFSCIAAKTYR